MAWVQRTDVGSPGLYEGASMAFDEQQGVMLHFGGDKFIAGASVGLPSNDLWQYNGVGWQQVTVAGTLPVARSGHALVYDPVDQRVLMFGGDAGGNVSLDDLWAFVFSGRAAGAWVSLTNLPSAGRWGMAMGYDAGRDVFIVTGGIKHGTAAQAPPSGSGYGEVKPATRETWLWNRTTWSAGPQSPEYINGPVQNLPDYQIKAGPAGGVVAHHAESGKTLLLSERVYGMVGQPGANIFYGGGAWPLYDGVQWSVNIGGNVSVADGNFPKSLYTSSATRVVAAYDPARRRVVAFGAGRTMSEEFTGTEWAGFTSIQIPAPTTRGSFGPLPAARLRPSMAHDSLRGRTVFFGGKASLTEPGDTWELIENAAVPFVITTDLSTTPLEPCQGETVTLMGAAAGVGPFKWRWYRDATFAAITVNPTLVLTNVNPAQTGAYTLEVEDSSGRRLTSSATPVFVHTPPVITQPPQERRVVPGESFSLQVSVSSTLPVTYQWHKDAAPIPGATSAIFTNASATVADAGNYVVFVTTRCTTLSSTGGRVYVGPLINQQPSAPAGQDVMSPLLSMTVTGNGVGSQVGTYTTGSDPAGHPNRHAPDSPTNPHPMTFTWRHEGVPLLNGPKYTITNTALTSNLVLNHPDYEDEGYYDCVVTDISGPAYAKTTVKTLLILYPLAPPYLTIQRTGPDPRNSSGMIYDSQRGRTVLFGGQAYGVNPLTGSASVGHYVSNDTWEWDGQVWIKRNPVTRPPPMMQFGMEYDSYRGRTVLFGGYKYAPLGFLNGTQVIVSDVWEWDGVNWMQITPPVAVPARTQPIMCFDTVGREILMIGGSAFNPEPADYYGSRKTLWGWNGAQWTQRGVMPNGNAAPYPNQLNTFAFDELRGVAVMFGTFSDNQNPVWEWDGATWTRVQPPLDLRITNLGDGNGASFYDPVRRMTGMPIIGNNFNPGFVFGTPYIVYWDGTRFIRGSTSVVDDVTGVPPSASEQSPFPGAGDLTAFDTRRRCLVWVDLFGNTTFSGTPPSTREMHFSAKARPVHFPVQVIFAPNQNIQLRVISAGHRPLIYQWFKDGSAILDNGHWTGADTNKFNINAITASDAGDYSVRITNLHNQVFTQNVRVSLQPDGVSTVVQGAGLVLSWPGTTGILETSPNTNGPWTAIYGVTPPYSLAMDEARRFYRVRYP